MEQGSCIRAPGRLAITSRSVFLEGSDQFVRTAAEKFLRSDLLWPT